MISFHRILICYRHCDTDFIFSTKLCFKIYSIKHWNWNWNKCKCLYNYWRYYERLQLRTSPKKWDTKLGVTHNHDVLSVYCWHVIFLDIFFITLMFVYLQKLLHFLIIYLYKTNPSFLPCPWNFAITQPSDFKSKYIFHSIKHWFYF